MSDFTQIDTKQAGEALSFIIVITVPDPEWIISKAKEKKGILYYRGCPFPKTINDSDE